MNRDDDHNNISQALNDFFDRYEQGPYSGIFFYEPEKKSYDINAFLRWCEIITDENGEPVVMPKNFWHMTWLNRP